MTRAYRNGPDYERYHVRVCARCGRRAGLSANWSDGPICRTCYSRALLTRGRCADCGTDRLLPGRDPSGVATCRDCAGITRNFFCDRCGHEGQLHTGRLCTRCTLNDRLATVLDDGTGTINPALTPLAEALAAMPRPLNGLSWLRSPQVQRLLGDLAAGRLPLTHDALHDQPNPQAVAYLRDLLMAHGALPKVDKQLLHFETWLRAQLAGIADDPHHTVLDQFGRWHLAAGLRRRAATTALTPRARHHAAERFTTAARFLAWLDTAGTALNDLDQALLDRWQTEHPDHTRRTLRAFLIWADQSRLLGPLEIPVATQTRAAPITQHQRITLLRRVLDATGSPAHARAVACLLLLYAQPVSRIVRLTIDDLDHPGHELLVRLGDPPSPVPEPFATLLTDLAQHRSNINTATNPDARWLFPGRRAGQPLHPGSLTPHLAKLGVPTTAARTAALRQLVLQAPAPVIAQALGYHHTTTTRAATEAGSTWKTYAPGHHAR